MRPITQLENPGNGIGAVAKKGAYAQGGFDAPDLLRSAMLLTFHLLQADLDIFQHRNHKQIKI